MIRQPKTEEQQEKFFDDCIGKYHDAVAKAGETRYYYELAGTTLCITFAGCELAPCLTPALEHLRIDTTENPDMVIHAWDTHSTGVEMVPPPCDLADFTDRGDIWGFNSKRIKTAFHWSEYSVNVMDMETNTGVYWVKKPQAFPYWVPSSPFRTLFHWWMEKRGNQLLHAASFGTTGGAVLLTGKGGAGKSSTALTCLQNGMLYLGDDYVVVCGGPAPTVYSLYCNAKVNKVDLPLYADMQQFVLPQVSPDQEKVVLALWPAFMKQFRKSMPLKAILTPVIGHQTTTSVQPIAFWPVQRAMSFTTMSQLPLVSEKTHHFINNLVSGLPCFSLELGSDRNLIPVTINALNDHPPTLNPTGKITLDDHQTPLISVIIPVYNREKFVSKVVANVFSQNYPAIELIMVDDGSTDGTRQAIESLPHDIRYFYQPNQGPASARNRGIRDASGEFIAFLDSDDLWPENNLRLLLKEFEQEPGLEVVKGFAQLFTTTEDGNIEYTGHFRNAFPDYIGAGLYRRSAFSKVGLFDPDLRFGEDADWFNRAREKEVRMKRTEAITLLVGRHGGNMTEGKNLVELNALKVFKKIIDRKRMNL